VALLCFSHDFVQMCSCSGYMQSNAQEINALTAMTDYLQSQLAACKCQATDHVLGAGSITAELKSRKP
jgi:hypothetical protein